VDDRQLIPLNWRGRIVFFLFFVFLMVVLAEIGSAMSRLNLGFSTLWPPSGLFFSALVFSQNKASDWRDIFLASALANFITDSMIHGSSVGITICFVASNSASAFVAALVARRFIAEPVSINRLKEMFIFLSCGLLIHSPISATAGLWLQSMFFGQHFSVLRWGTWWSANALGITCFAVLSLSLLKLFSGFLLSKITPEMKPSTNWHLFDNRPGELLLIWTIFLSILALVQYNIAAPIGLVLNNLLLFVWAYRFGIVHASVALAFACVLRLSHAWSSWMYMTPFLNIFLPGPTANTSDAQVGAIASVQIYLIERGMLINFAAALFADLRFKRKALQDASDARERLVARMSHEIRTPLGGMLGMVEAWAMKENSPQRAQDLRMILNSAEQLKRVIDDVLDYSKLSAGKMRTQALKCNIRELFHELVSLHAADAKKKGLSLELKISSQLPDEIMIDSLRLRQIVNNLLANAVKFTPVGWVRVRLESKSAWDTMPPHLQIVVEDSGIGISQSSLKELFQPFEQAGNETTRAYGGTGLGLAICRELSELLGGRISVESTRGVGTRFLVEIPFSPFDEAKMPKQEPLRKIDEFRSLAQTKKGIAVLVVEDDPINQIVATRFLEAEGCEVVAVDSGSQALEILHDRPGKFALVLMDYFMPMMDGCEVTRRYRASEHNLGVDIHLPIVGLTASILEADHHRCRESGMDDVLLKPLDRKNLRELLKKYFAA
jgi:signal transduction histidine kinase/ActR/RegA family two-component response regulator